MSDAGGNFIADILKTFCKYLDTDQACVIIIPSSEQLTSRNMYQHYQQTVKMI